MRDIHFTTLPEVQAQIWQETLTKLGIHSTKICGTVRAEAKQDDLEIAWALFREEFERIIA